MSSCDFISLTLSSAPWLEQLKQLVRFDGYVLEVS